MKIKGFKYCKNYNDYLSFAKSFCTEDGVFISLNVWDDFFGANIPSDLDDGHYLMTLKEYDGILEKSPLPQEFPVEIYYFFGESRDGLGRPLIHIWDWEKFNDK